MGGASFLTVFGHYVETLDAKEAQDANAMDAGLVNVRFGHHLSFQRTSVTLAYL